MKTEKKVEALKRENARLKEKIEELKEEKVQAEKVIEGLHEQISRYMKADAVNGSGIGRRTSRE